MGCFGWLKKLNKARKLNYELHERIKHMNLLIDTMTEQLKESEKKISDLEAELERGKSDVILGNLRFRKYWRIVETEPETQATREKREGAGGDTQSKIIDINEKC